MQPITPLIQVRDLSHGVIRDLSFSWPAGVHWICGDEGRGKTTLLRLLAGELAPEHGSVTTPLGDVFWVDLLDASNDANTVHLCWQNQRSRHAHWDEALRVELSQALKVSEHHNKQLHMLSAGTRRKVGIIAALASGATVTLLDQPFAALDMASIRVLHDFLHEAAEQRHRAWIVADYEAPTHLPQASVLTLP
jgi:ABC-type multidrug transport system ATPase subunit